ncbi:MAG: hypothetical protein CMK83_03710 [Pseudomonadales bacterium]|nr:hypothetical protein [Pseudomonadales bacterium]MCK5789656.1 hypothetical protein [Ketobacter sp.]MEC8812481.1 LuxR C-terminal-related transcriptional regulator [Pseudomonadota bacterium]TNC89791.1 MAG: hypothetical protein CSH49_05835 [Alcanivorax sp.]HAG94180.1 hypothetical protein [Gammaproteobacteria bacterium]|tara:strand:+ start:14416 stop:17091 length:2676 start_codon:yes stop_codon:yes gene_type:complete
MKATNNKTVAAATDLQCTLPRSRLTDRILRTHLNTVWIGAPRGLGKTILLRQLTQLLLLTISPRRVLAIDIDQHNALGSLLQHLRHALPEATGTTLSSLTELLQALLGKPARRDTLHLLIDGLDTRQHGSLIHYLIESSKAFPGQIRLYLAVDDFVPLLNHRLFNDTRMLHLAMDDLRMTEAEIQSLLALYGGAPNDHDARRLLQLTDGIPAALTQLLSNAPVSGTPRHQLLCNWIEHNLVSYLEPMEVLRLASLSILREFNLQQATRLLGVPGAETRRWLQRYIPLLFVHDTEQDRFVWSQLIQPFFFHCLLNQYRDLLPNILKRSEPWLTDSHFDERCLGYLIQSIKKAWAQDIILSKCRTWFEQRNASSLLQLMEHIPADDCLAQTELALYYCWALILQRRIKEANRWIQLIEQYDTPAIELQDNLLVLRTLTQIFDYPRPPCHQSATLLEQCLDKHSLFQGEVLSFYANMLHAVGASGVSKEALLKAIRFHQSNHNLSHLSHARMLYWRFEFNEGETGTVLEAAQLYLQELKQNKCQSESGDDMLAVDLAIAMVQSGIADFLHERNHMPEAKTLYLESIPVLTQSEWTYTSVVAQVGLTRLLINSGDHEAANREMETIKKRVVNRENTGLNAILCFETMRILRSQGKSVLPAATQYEMDLNNLTIESLFEDQLDKERLFWIKCYIMVLLEQKNFTSALIYAVKGLIKSLHLRDNRCRTQFANIKALCEYELGQKQDAIKSINEAMQLAQKYGFLQTMLRDDFGWGKVWLEVDQKRAFDALLVPSFISEIRTQLQAGTADNHTAAGQHPLDVSRSAKLESCRQLGLTEKEYEILKLLAEGLCNKKIASRSQIALTTVKWHLQNIFGKLQARNRTEAVVKAQEHSLIGH